MRSWPCSRFFHIPQGVCHRQSETIVPLWTGRHDEIFPDNLSAKNGRDWESGVELPHVRNGDNSQTTFDCFGGVYYLGWQEKTQIADCKRSVFNIDVSDDAFTGGENTASNRRTHFSTQPSTSIKEPSGSPSRRATTAAPATALCSGNCRKFLSCARKNLTQKNF